MITAPGGSHAQGVHPGVQADVHPDVHPYTLACDLTCTLAYTLPPVHSGVHPDVHPEIPGDTDCISCRKGLSAAQINIIGLLLAIGPTVTPYKHLSAELERVYSMKRSPGAVRQIVLRLVNRGYLRRKQAKIGTSQGVTFTLIQEMLCPHIRPAGPCPCAPVHPGVRPDVHPGVHPDADFSPSILREKIDRNILSISSENSKRYTALLESLAEEDVAFHWPELARAGFGTVQVRQIIQRRAQVGETLEHIMQGLTYAEWELARQCMTTHKGEPVSNPLNWVFKILATQGYYPRPTAYISPAEQAERDREATTRREKEAYEARREAEADAWIASLTPDARTEILGPDERRIAIPAAVRLRQHFRQHIWPDREREPDPQAAGHDEGGGNSHE